MICEVDMVTYLELLQVNLSIQDGEKGQPISAERVNAQIGNLPVFLHMFTIHLIY